MSDIPAEGLRFIASAVRRGANPPGVPALLDEAAAELTRLRADLAQLEQESDAEITALRACLASAEADLAAAQEREQRMREAGLLALKIAESWIHDQCDGTDALEPALAELDEARGTLSAMRGEP